MSMRIPLFLSMILFVTAHCWGGDPVSGTNIFYALDKGIQQVVFDGAQYFNGTFKPRNNITSIEVMSNGNVVTGDAGIHNGGLGLITQWDFDGETLSAIRQGRIDQIHDIALGPDDEIYGMNGPRLSDNDNQRLVRWKEDPDDGAAFQEFFMDWEQFDNGFPSQLVGSILGVGKDGDVIASNPFDQQLAHKWFANVDNSWNSTRQPATNFVWNNPQRAIAPAADGSMWLASGNGWVVRTTWTTQSGGASAQDFHALTVDAMAGRSDNFMFVVDPENQSVNALLWDPSLAGGPDDFNFGSGDIGEGAIRMVQQAGRDFAEDLMVLDEDGVLHLASTTTGQISAYTYDADSNILSRVATRKLYEDGREFQISDVGAFHDPFGVVVPPIVGDYDGDQLVGDGDLVLVLDNWYAIPSAEWSTNVPSGMIGLVQLNNVLFNWGRTLPLTAVPEPATVTLLLLGGGLCLRRNEASLVFS